MWEGPVRAGSLERDSGFDVVHRKCLVQQDLRNCAVTSR